MQSASVSPVWLAHPRAFWSLFATEMFERYCYFGIRAILVLYLVAETGLGLPEADAVAIFGLFSAGTYLAGLAGGWLGDRHLGGRAAVLSGGVLILGGSLLLLGPIGHASFYVGLWVIVAGVGLLKPNISAMMAALYPGSEERLDGAFTLYYMGVCIGAAVAAIVTPIVADAFGWRWGFAAAASGMAASLLVFVASRHWLGSVGRAPDSPFRSRVLITLVFGFAAIVWLLATGRSGLAVTAAADAATIAIALLGAGFFIWVFGFAGLNPAERGRMWLCLVLCLACMLYWSGADLAGSSLNLFAEVHTDRSVAWAGSGVAGEAYRFPAGLFLSFNPFLIVVLAPVASMVWDWLASRRQLPSAPAKFGLALLFASGAMLVMVIAAGFASTGARVAPGWLLSTYFLLTIGELLLSPVGLAAINRLSPQRLAGRMMGVWFLAVALGTLVASRLAGRFPSADAAAMATGYGLIAAVLAAGGLAMFVWRRRIAGWED